MELTNLALSIVATVVAAGSAYMSWHVYQGQQALLRRQFLIQLWDRLEHVRAIVPDDPHPDDVRDALNTLELVAVAWTSEMVDGSLIEMVFGRQFVQIAEQIKACSKIGGSFQGRPGDEILDEVLPVQNLLRRLLSDEIKLEVGKWKGQ